MNRSLARAMTALDGIPPIRRVRVALLRAWRSSVVGWISMWPVYRLASWMPDQTDHAACGDPHA